jgi:hypothetical protein
VYRALRGGDTEFRGPAAATPNFTGQRRRRRLTAAPVRGLWSAQALAGRRADDLSMETPVQTTEERSECKPDRKPSSRPLGGRVSGCCARRLQQTCTLAALTLADGNTYVFPRRFVDISAPGIHSLGRH